MQTNVSSILSMHFLGSHTVSLGRVNCLKVYITIQSGLIETLWIASQGRSTIPTSQSRQSFGTVLFTSWRKCRYSMRMSIKEHFISVLSPHLLPCRVVMSSDMRNRCNETKLSIATGVESREHATSSSVNYRIWYVYWGGAALNYTHLKISKVPSKFSVHINEGNVVCMIFPMCTFQHILATRIHVHVGMCGKLC